MGKPIKKVYLPTGLIVSMYNLYGGNGSGNEILTMPDVQIMTACLEYYYNYTNPNANKYYYQFYTLPHFYTANRNEENDMRVKKGYRDLQKKHLIKVSDYDEAGEQGLFFTSAVDLNNKKIEKIKNTTPLGSLILSLNNAKFRVKEVFNIKRYTGKKIIEDNPCKTYSSFFRLKSGMSKSVLDKASFDKNDAELKLYLNQFFSSDSYKLLSDNKEEDYGINPAVFLKYFSKAIASYKSFGISEMNRKYLQVIEMARSNDVEIEIVE